MCEETPSPDGPDEFPTEEELPNEPISVDDIDPFIIGEEGFEDIDEFAAAEWQSQRER